MKQNKLHPRWAMLPALALAFSLAVLPARAAQEGGDSSDELVVMPIAENQSCYTYADVQLQGQLRAADPDGGKLTFELVEQPKKGTVTLDREDTAQFVYLPHSGKTGQDAFTFCAKDEDGNVSDPATVKIEILKNKSGVRYADMKGHAAETAAIRLAEAGVCTGRRVGQESFFGPNEAVSRSEFLTMAMTAAGITPSRQVSVTGFSDDAAIPAWAKSYASEALHQGLITGKPDNDRVVFSAEEPITYSEAAVILNRVMAVTDVDAETFAGENVPAWAVQSVANLSSVDLLGSGTDCSTRLNRAAAAQLLCSAMDLMEESKGGLFGWLQ